MEITIEKEIKLLNTKSNFKISLCQTHFCISQENITFLYGKDVQVSCFYCFFHSTLKIIPKLA